MQSYILKIQINPGFDLKQRVENDYVPNKDEYPKTVTSVQSIWLNYQPYYNSNINYQYNGVRNQLLFAKHGNTGDDEGNRKDKEQIPIRKLDHNTCNYCGEKGHYYGNSKQYTHTKIKKDAEAFRNMKHEKYGNTTHDRGDQKALVNVKDTSCTLMMGAPTENWYELLSPGLMFCLISTKEVL